MQYKKIGYGLELKVYLGNIIQISFRVSGHKLSTSKKPGQKLQFLSDVLFSDS